MFDGTVSMAAIKNISDTNQILKLKNDSDKTNFEIEVKPNQIVENIPDDVALYLLKKLNKIWAPADDYTKNLIITPPNMSNILEKAMSILSGIANVKVQEPLTLVECIENKYPPDYIPSLLRPAVLSIPDITKLNEINHFNKYSPCNLRELNKYRP